jgi:TonB family protein
VTLASRTIVSAVQPVVLIASSASAQQAAGTAPLVAEPSRGALSAGEAIGELGAKGALGADRLTAMMKDPRPLVRKCAARLVRVLEARALVAPLLAALASENDRAAAGEMVAALAALTTGESDEALFVAAERFSGSLNEALLRGIGQRPTPPPAPLLRRLAGLKLHEDAWRDFFTWSLGPGLATLDDAAGEVVKGGDSAAWAGLLSAASAGGRSPATPTLEFGLSSPDESVRAATCWFLLRRARAGEVDRSWLARWTETAPEPRDEGGAASRLAIELVRRAAGLSARDQAGRLAEMTPSEAHRIPANLSILRRLSTDERRAYSRASYGDPGWLDDRLKVAPKEDERSKAQEPRWMGTPSDLLPGLAEETMAATGCRIEDAPFALLEVRHDANGGREGFGIVVPNGVAPACEPAIRGLLLSTLIPPRQRPLPRETRLALLPLGPDYFACVASKSPSPRPAVRPQGDARIAEPKKIRNVAPIYPAAMRDKRIQGVVVLEALISPQGCISSTEVVRSVEPLLDAAALGAVSQWRYTPTLLEGVPVPVVMTVTVNFRLSY